jgi:hypothetical protein
MTKLIRGLNIAGYQASMGSKQSIANFGGRKIPADRFLPALNSSFDSDESYIDINHIDSDMTDRVEVEINGKIIHESNGFIHECYIVNNDKLKWDIIFLNAGVVPPSIRFRVRHSNNLIWYRQVLSSQDILNGNDYIVPEAHNSFAVYYNNDNINNKYQTGKVCHLYSPYFLDESGAKSPLLDMILTPNGNNVKILTFIVNTAVQTWLDNPLRVGKIRLDPTLGYDTLGSLTENISPSFGYVDTALLMPEDGNITGMFAYLARTTDQAVGLVEVSSENSFAPAGTILTERSDQVSLATGLTPTLINFPLQKFGTLEVGKYYRFLTSARPSSGNWRMFKDVGFGAKLQGGWLQSWPGVEVQDPTASVTSFGFLDRRLSVWTEYDIPPPPGKISRQRFKRAR